MSRGAHLPVLGQYPQSSGQISTVDRLAGSLRTGRTLCVALARGRSDVSKTAAGVESANSSAIMGAASSEPRARTKSGSASMTAQGKTGAGLEGCRCSEVWISGQIEASVVKEAQRRGKGGDRESRGPGAGGAKAREQGVEK